MLWRVFNVLAFISFFVAINVALLWLRSRSHIDKLSHAVVWNAHLVVSFARHGHPWRGTSIALESYDSKVLFVFSYADCDTDDSGEVIEPIADKTGEVLGVRWTHEWLLLRLLPGNQRYGCISSMVGLGNGYDDYVWKTYGATDALIVSLTSILPAIWGILFFRRRRLSRAGLCQKCGYDLRANPDRCPECGASFSRHSTPAVLSE